MITRNELEKLYAEKTGLDAAHGVARIDIMEKVVHDYGLGVDEFTIVNDPDEINYGWQEGRKWFSGKEIEGKICLGYTNRGTGRDNCRNAIFMLINSPKI